MRNFKRAKTYRRLNIVLFALIICVFSCNFSFAANSVNMNFNEVPLSSFVRTMSKTLGQKIVADPVVADLKISVVADKPVSIKEAREIMLSVFEMNNLGTQDMGDYTRVIALKGKITGITESDSSYDAAAEALKEEEELRKSQERLQMIKAYMASPVIPFDAKQYAGLVIKKTDDDKKTAQNSSAGASNRWSRFLSRVRGTDSSAEIYAVINSGTVIPAMLISGVNTDLPGNMLAQVSENVYDSPTGKRLLIPQGSRLFGLYDSKVLFGQKRPLIKWTRLIYPDGSTLNLENMPGTDKRGYAGFKPSKRNNHFWPMVSNAALVSIFAGIATYYDKTNVTINQPTINLGATNLPVGSVVCWTNSNYPSNWLLLNGTEFDATTYPDLYEVRGSTTLPSYDNSDPEKQWIIKAADDTASITALLNSSSSAVTGDAGSTVGRELGKSLQQMATKVLEKYIEMAPTLLVKPGYKFSVMVNKEILLPVKNYGTNYLKYVNR